MENSYRRNHSGCVSGENASEECGQTELIDIVQYSSLIPEYLGSTYHLQSHSVPHTHTHVNNRAVVT